MANFGRMLGNNIYELMLKEDIKPQMLAEHLNCSIGDVWNIIEGKIIVIPEVMNKISVMLGTTLEDLLKADSQLSIPRIECLDKFSNPDNLDVILDLIDEYVELKEAR